MHKFLQFSLFKRCLVYLLIIVAASGCATIKLVGDYDEQIDKGTTAFQKDVETFLVNLESSAAKPEDMVAAYADNKHFYADSRVTLSGLRLRADAIERNSLTVRAFDKLGANIDMLEDMHKAGITRVEVSKLIRPGFTQQFTAILTFELAKKRGEKPDEAKILTEPSQNTSNAGANK